MKLVKFILLFILAVFFVSSALFKLYPVEMLELELGVHLGVAEWLAMVIARLLIGYEILLGFLLILYFNSRRVLLLALITVLLFSMYLIYLKILFPSVENCGCMGMVVPMTPTESLIKNGVMILLIILQFYLKDDFVPNWIFQLQKLKWSLFIIAFLCPFLINGVDFRKDVLRQRLSENINKDVLKVVESSTQNGNEILLYLSPNCVFCKMQAKKWMWFKKRNHWNVRVHVVFMGVNINDEIKQFLTETSLEYDQYEVMPPKEFIHLTQGLLPSIYLVRNDQIIQKDNFISFNEQNLRGQLSR